MLEKSITVYKQLGETPLFCLERARKEYKIPENMPMTYAGRLDPMAEGLMIILIGDECRNKDKYLGLDKTYEFQILVGFSTDTYDLLGLADSSFDKYSSPRTFSPDMENLSKDSINKIKEVLPQFLGTFTQKYPAFSSKTVGGKQLFQLSKDDELPETLPEHEVTIHNLHCTSTVIQSKKELEKEIKKRIALVKGDFRQEEIIKKWTETLEKTSEKEFTIISCTADCSSGTYIRQLISDISYRVEVPLVTYSIKRTKIGDYSL